LWTPQSQLFFPNHSIRDARLMLLLDAIYISTKPAGYRWWKPFF
jgi:hypothetical protein